MGLSSLLAQLYQAGAWQVVTMSEALCHEEMAFLLKAIDRGGILERCAALRELALCGEQAIPILVERLRDPELILRTEASAILAEMGRSAVPFLLNRLHDEDRDFQKAIIVTLGHLGPEAGEALPFLEPYLQQESIGPVVLDAIAKISRPGRSQWLLWLKEAPAPSGLTFFLLLLSAFLVGGLSTVRAQQIHLFPTARTIACTLGLLGATMGLIIGSYFGKVGRTALLTVVLGIGSSIAGLLLGSLFTEIIEPILQALRL